MATPRSHFVALFLPPSGRVLVAGGSGPSGTPLTEAEFYVSGNNSFASAAKMLVDRSDHTGTLLAGNRVLVTGGGSQAGIEASAELFPGNVRVAIDIKPGSFPNSINLGSGGAVPVAILSSASFDAATVDPITVTLASAPVKVKGKGRPMSSLEDVNGDGLLDLVVHVETEALQLSDSDTEAVLEGKTLDGRAIRGSDSVRVVP